MQGAAFAALGLACSSASRGEPSADSVNPRDFGAIGNGVAPDSAAFQRAIDSGRPVWVPSGRFLVGNLVLRSGTRITGEGSMARLVQAPAARYLLSVNQGSAGTADVRNNVRDIRIASLSLDGQVESVGFSEHSHIVNLNACSEVLLEGCEILGFRGDGVYLGSGNSGRDERHNTGVTIRSCIFDGRNRNNRNAISVIDCDGLVVEQCLFQNSTRPNMPGAIDIEPDRSPFHVVRNIRISSNRFRRIGGNLGAICLHLVHKRYAVPVCGVSIEDNRIHGSGVTAGLSLVSIGDCSPATPDMEIGVVRNWIVDASSPFHIDGLHGVTFASNRVEGARTEGVVGLPKLGRNGRIALLDNDFEDLGVESSRGIRVYPGGPIDIRGNRFRRWGPRASPSAVALDLSEAETDMLVVRDNSFAHGGGGGRVAIALSEANRHSAVEASNRFSDGLVKVR